MAVWKVAHSGCIGSFDLNSLPVPYKDIQTVKLADYSGAYYLIRSIFKYRHGKGYTTPPPFPQDVFAPLDEALKLYEG